MSDADVGSMRKSVRCEIGSAETPQECAASACYLASTITRNIFGDAAGSPRQRNISGQESVSTLTKKFLASRRILVKVVSASLGYDFETVLLMTRVIEEAWGEACALLAPSANLEAIHAAMVHRIMHAVNEGERDPARLRAVALSKPCKAAAHS
ncbi:MAG TPA: hypothetical protein VGA65_01150 [Hyphomicrobium sp.]